MPARKVVGYDSDQMAKLLNLLGVKPKVSTGICGGITYGYGKLDNNGYWQFMLDIEYDGEPWPIEIHYGGHSIRSWVDADTPEEAVQKVLEEVQIYVEDDPTLW